MTQHLCGIDDFDRSTREALFSRAARHADAPSKNPVLDGKIVACLFFEPSTRTHLSFESAAQRLGMGVIGFDDPSVTSAAKGETLEDTIRVVQTFADCIVLRHPEAGAAARAAAVAGVPVVNAGDGDNEHPTQTLLDMFTVQRECGRLNGLNIVFAGDVRWGRTAHSLALAMAPGNQLTFVAPDALQVTDDFAAETAARGAAVSKTQRLADAVPAADVIYMTRPQRERWPEGVTDSDVDVLTPELLQTAKSDAIVMHPLPRTAELPVACDADQRARYFQQVANGVPVRMAILEHLLGA